MPPPGDAGASGLPCDVASMLAANCTGCHSDPPATGALTGLVTYADLMKTAIEDATKNEAQLSLARMQGNPMPYMPPGSSAPPAADVTVLQNWITAGMPMGTCGGSGSDGGVPPPPSSVFKGQPPFMSQAANGGHNPGRACFNCHTSSCTGGNDCGPELVFGGTLYDGSGTGVAGAEVRFVDANGNGTSVYTASKGDFWLRGSPAFAAPAHVGVRNATSVKTCSRPCRRPRRRLRPRAATATRATAPARVARRADSPAVTGAASRWLPGAGRAGRRGHVAPARPSVQPLRGGRARSR